MCIYLKLLLEELLGKFVKHYKINLNAEDVLITIVPRPNSFDFVCKSTKNNYDATYIFPNEEHEDMKGETFRFHLGEWSNEA